MHLSDRLSAIALIKNIKEMYGDAGIDIQPRIDTWLEKHGTTYAGMEDHHAIGLALAMEGAFNREWIASILSQEASRTLREMGISRIEFLGLMQALEPRDRDAWFSEMPEKVREELSRFAGAEPDGESERVAA